MFEFFEAILAVAIELGVPCSTLADAPVKLFHFGVLLSHFFPSRLLFLLLLLFLPRPFFKIFYLLSDLVYLLLPFDIPSCQLPALSY